MPVNAVAKICIPSKLGQIKKADTEPVRIVGSRNILVFNHYVYAAHLHELIAAFPSITLFPN